MIGRALGLDLGDRTLGMAVSDGLGLTAQGLETRARFGGQRDLEAVKAVCADQEVVRIVLGWPRNMNGSEGPRAEKTRSFGRALRAASGLPVWLWDERLTTAEAERLLIAADVSRRKRDRVIDKLAAQLILQSWLDAGGPEVDPA